MCRRGVLVAPWPVTEVMVRRLAERYADLLLPIIDADEQQARIHNRWGCYTSRDTSKPAKICAETDAQFQQARQGDLPAERDDVRQR